MVVMMTVVMVMVAGMNDDHHLSLRHIGHREAEE